ncbi:demethylmenaquinone methyltransferase [Pseudonocardia oroxyli]|uniref:demethylmenaquinone methyltransferase n=1 Tax=Pseudonocardia oroxyli TaxID=366584 RepID=UPI000B872A0F|nr:demethylmenaquinone methyltransferase [Pseudonocardia oroxyli]
MSRAELDKDPADVAAMFDGVAKRYDLTNTVLTAGQDRRWRALTREALELRPGQRVLDLAAGTAVSTVELAKSGAYCVAADFSLGMLRAGAGRAVPKVAADALHLPFADGSFDAVTISFGLRNVADTARALGELARVTRPGGRLVVCEFGTPSWTPYRVVYQDVMLRRVLPAIARRVSSNPDAYTYLSESIVDWPPQRRLAEIIAGAGWSRVAWRDLAGGAVALHRAVRPA